MKAQLRTPTRIAAAALIVAMLPLAVSDAAIDRAAPGSPATFSMYTRTGPVGSCEFSGQDAICSQTLVKPLRFTVPANAGSRATISVSFQYRTSGLARFSASVGDAGKAVIVPARRPLAPSTTWTSVTLQYFMRGLVPGSRQDLGVNLTTDLIGNLPGSAVIETSRLLVTADLR